MFAITDIVTTYEPENEFWNRDETDTETLKPVRDWRADGDKMIERSYVSCKSSMVVVCLLYACRLTRYQSDCYVVLVFSFIFNGFHYTTFFAVMCRNVT